MKKALPEVSIMNELKGRSAFFSSPPSSSASKQSTSVVPQLDIVRTSERSNGRAPAQENTRIREQANARTSEHLKIATGQRVIKRQSYNVYQDQHEALKRLEATSMLSGKSIFISEMVREAIDQYLQKY